jgi:hypothetical protein
MTLNIPNIKINEKSTQWKAAVTSSMKLRKERGRGQNPPKKCSHNPALTHVFWLNLYLSQ